MSEAKWIVKSSGRILGPVSLEEIVEAVRSKTFSVLDEVREPYSRWTFLREHPALQSIVRQIRDEQTSGLDNTQSTFVTSNRTVTSSVTERLVEESEVTPDPTASGGMKSISAVEKNVSRISLGGKNFGVLSDQKVQNQLQRQNHQLRYLLYAFCIIAAAAAVLYWRNQKGPSLSAGQAQEMMKLARDLASRGEYALAYKTVSEVELQRGLPPGDRLLKLKLVLVKDDANPVELTRLLDSLNQPGVAESLGSNMDLFRGLTQSKLGHTREAQNFYQKALEQSPTSEESALNLATSLLLSGEPVRAWSLLQSFRPSEQRPYYQVVKSMAALRSEDPQVLRAAFEEFRGFDDNLDRQLNSAEASGSVGRGQRPDQIKASDAGRDLRFERLLLNAMLAQRVGQSEWVDQFRRKLAQANPFEAKNYLRSPLLDWQLVDWRLLRGYCDAFRKGQPDDAVMRSIGALCSAASGDLVSARTAVDAASRQFRGDTTVVGVDSLLLMHAGRESEAERIVQMYAVTDRILIHWVRGEICEKRRDSVCADRAWTQVRSLDPFEPRAFYGLAQAAKDMMNDQKYIENVALGPKYAPNYVPLLSLTSTRHEF